MAFTAIATNAVSNGTTATVTWTSIPSSYQHLYLLGVGASDGRGSTQYEYDNVKLTVNGQTSGYNGQNIGAIAGSFSSGYPFNNQDSDYTFNNIQYGPSGTTSDNFSVYEAYFWNYADNFAGGSGDYHWPCWQTNTMSTAPDTSDYWGPTNTFGLNRVAKAAIATITMNLRYGTYWIEGSTFTLYGISA